MQEKSTKDALKAHSCSFCGEFEELSGHLFMFFYISLYFTTFHYVSLLGAGATAVFTPEVFQLTTHICFARLERLQERGSQRLRPAA